MIVIVDYQCGNLGSIKNMLKKLGFEAIISSQKDIILQATKIILPGVGHFDNGMSNIHNLGLFDALNEKAINQKTPILGICLGMQLMTYSSEEGMQKGLCWIEGECKRFNFSQNELPVPHMGWNFVKTIKESKLTKDFPHKPKFYFVHSFYVQTFNNQIDLFSTNYGIDFVSGFEKDNIIGVQFHPEKSHFFGMQLLKNFVNNY